MRFCRVLVASAVPKAYDYAVPDGMEVGVGDYVTVPLGSRALPGVVWELPAHADAPPEKIKTVLVKHDIPPMTEIMRGFIDWVAAYTMEPRGGVLKMALSVPAALDEAEGTVAYALASPSPAALSLSPKAQSVVAALANGHPQRMAALEKAAGVTSSVVKTLVKQGIVRAVMLKADAPCSHPDPDHNIKTLSGAQHEAAQKIVSRVRNGGYEAFLLDGVTGSGKTEVYFEAVAQALRGGRQVLILMPEIALSNAFMTRFAERFGEKPALWHSSLSPALRRRTWRGVALGESKVVVGARSALFLPFANLSLIIVDEEHDSAFKQEEILIYNARDMAIVRAHQGQIPIALVSATPALETIQNAWSGRSVHLELPDRYGGASKPDIRIVDLRIEKPERGKFIAPLLRDQIAATIADNHQALLFLNRRGFAPLTLCRSCGHRMECPKCTAWLVEHRRTGHLHCHHCGFHMKEPEKCPSCTDTDSFVACGPGVERIAEEVAEAFPTARSLILASDVTDTHDKLTTALEKIRSGEVDIIIGTQIIAKGHHFPNITCVGVIDADLGLSGGDLRAGERTFQLLHQVAGRAGREAFKGTVFLQTYNTDQRVIQMLGKDDRDGFLRAEMNERERAHMPPFTRLAAIILAGPDEDQTQSAALMLGRAAPRLQGVQVLGPAPAQMYRIRGNFRQRLLVIAEKNVALQKVLADWISAVKLPSKVRLTIDIDPYSFL
ncbi:MAG: primosomal protein N' [Pseudobdellovibrionaceae bacterium]